MDTNEEYMKKEIELRFTYHSPNPVQTQHYTVIRGRAKRLAETFAALCPDSRERSLAITKLEESVMWANAAIARRSVDEAEQDALRELGPKTNPDA